jgi:hypothetical protein
MFRSRDAQSEGRRELEHEKARQFRIGGLCCESVSLEYPSLCEILWVGHPLGFDGVSCAVEGVFDAVSQKAENGDNNQSDERDEQTVFNQGLSVFLMQKCVEHNFVSPPMKWSQAAFLWVPPAPLQVAMLLPRVVIPKGGFLEIEVRCHRRGEATRDFSNGRIRS